MQLSKSQYKQMYQEASKNSPSYLNIPKAFIIGGIICLLGEAISRAYTEAGLSRETASIWTSVTLIFISALLTALRIYPKIAKHGGAGTLVPITGFANSVVSPAIEFKSEGWILGLGAKIFIICGPVILYGTSASIIYGFIYYIFGMFSA